MLGGAVHIEDVARTIRPSLEGKNAWNSNGTGNMIVPKAVTTEPIPIDMQNAKGGEHWADPKRKGGGIGKAGDPMYTLLNGSCHAVHCAVQVPETAETIRPSTEGKCAVNSNGTGNMVVQETSGTLQASDYKGARNFNPGSNLVVPETCGTIAAGAHPSGYNGQDAYTGNLVPNVGTVRRLTPVECCRLQGFPDDWNAWGIDAEGNRVEISDAQRYRQAGNAVTVNVAEWIGRRIMEHAGG